MRSKASLKGVALDLRVDDDVPPVEGSVADLNQVWMHLVDNAIDAAPESGRVSIEMKRDHDVVVVRVIDDGPGIPAEDRERVFEPFFTTKDVGQGRGLGLDIVRTVVAHAPRLRRRHLGPRTHRAPRHASGGGDLGTGGTLGPRVEASTTGATLKLSRWPPPAPGPSRLWAWTPPAPGRTRTGR